MKRPNRFSPSSPARVSNAFFCITLCLSAWVPLSAWAATDSSMSFFITSANPGHGANLGGLAGADAHCRTLAEAVGAGGRSWYAYLSTQPTAEKPAVNARDRIGAGPWRNAKGLVVATSVADLHGPNNKLSKENSLNEKGEVINGRGDSPNRHDILTGSRIDGTAFRVGADSTCANWTSETTGSAMLGHHDRHGVASNIDSTSWNQSHMSNGCSPANLTSTGGSGFFYCFASGAAVGIGNREGRHSWPRPGGFVLLRTVAGGGGIIPLPGAAGQGEAAATVFALDGRRIADLRVGSSGSGGREARWDGRDSRGNPVAGGLYLISVTIR